MSSFDLVSGLVDGAFRAAVIAIVAFPAYLVWCFFRGRRSGATPAVAEVTASDPGRTRASRWRRIPRSFLFHALAATVVTVGVASVVSADDEPNCPEYRAALVRAVSNPYAYTRIEGLDDDDTREIEDDRATFRTAVDTSPFSRSLAYARELENWEPYAAKWVQARSEAHGCN